MIARLRQRQRRARRITIDLDVTEDATHGAQQLTFFNGFYGGWCYLPLMAFLTIDDEPRQYLVAAVLRPGNAATAAGERGLLRRLVPKVWAAFPRARVRVRLDGGFATPALFDELEAAGVEYVVAMATNPVLATAAAPLLAEARTRAEATGTSARVFGEPAYQARTWAHPRRAVLKAEVVVHPGRDLRDNPRTVITNLRHHPERLYREIYCARGDSENRLKELHHDLAVGRTSCSRFWANQLRVTLTAAAYVLLQELQWRADRTSFARAQVGRLRLVLLKIGVRVTRSVRRDVLICPGRIPICTRGGPSPTASVSSAPDRTATTHAGHRHGTRRVARPRRLGRHRRAERPWPAPACPNDGSRARRQRSESNRRILNRSATQSGGTSLESRPLTPVGRPRHHTW